MKTTRVAGPCMGILLVLGLAACGSTPFEYQDQTETPEGEGLFTGKEGAVTVSTEGDGRSASTRSETAGASSPADCGCPEGAELEAYREFLRWKAEALGTDEYREFQQWRQWRRQRSSDE